MRFDGKKARIQPTRFMACITLDDGTQYSTHMQKEGEPAIESSIIITPQNPYSLRVNDLTHEFQNAFNDVGVGVFTYYWSLPGGLRIVEESFSGQNSSSPKLVYVYGLNLWAYNMYLGMAIRRGVTSLTLSDMNSSYQNREVPLINGDSMLRAARCYGAGQTSNYDTLTYWTITDNYGCESRFVLKCRSRSEDEDHGNSMEMLNG